MKRLDEELRAQVLKEARETGNVSMVARKHEVAASMLYYWLRKESGDGKTLLGRERVRRLGRDLERTQQENEILKELLKKTNQVWLGDSRSPESSLKKGS